jgi:hypothetical protein
MTPEARADALDYFIDLIIEELLTATPPPVIDEPAEEAQDSAA